LSILHKIDRQILEITLSESTNSYGIQSEFRDVFYQEILPILDEELTRFSPGKELVVIDRLELQISDVLKSTKLTDEILDSFRSQLKDQLALIRNDISKGNFNGTVKLDLTSDAVSWQKSEVHYGLADALITFLEAGFLRWKHLTEIQTVGASNESNIKQLVSRVLDSSSEQLGRFIIDNIQYTRIQQRVYHHFSLAQLKELLMKNFLSPLDLKLSELEELKKEISILSGMNSVPSESQEKSIWWALFILLANLKTTQMRKEWFLPIYVELIKNELNLTSINFQRLISFLDKEPNKVKQLRTYLDKANVNVDQLIKKHQSFDLGTTVEREKTRTEVSKWFSDRKNLFQLTEVLPILENNWFKEWNENIRENTKEGVPTKVELIDQSNQEQEKRIREEIEEAGISVSNAGLVLLAYFIPYLFDHLKWLDEERNLLEDCLPKALSLTQYLVFGEAATVDESGLTLNKLILGIDLDEVITNDYQLSEEEKQQADGLIENVISKWDALGKVSVEGFRISFLQREGIVYLRDEQYLLRVEKKTLDILMDKLPWSIGVVKLSWMPKMIVTEW